MTRTEYVNSIETDADTLQVLGDSEIENYGDGVIEYQIRYLKKNGANASITAIQYFVYDNTVYPRE